MQQTLVYVEIFLFFFISNKNTDIITPISGKKFTLGDKNSVATETATQNAAPAITSCHFI